MTSSALQRAIKNGSDSERLDTIFKTIFENISSLTGRIFSQAQNTNYNV
jgi:hypothetical protein